MNEYKKIRKQLYNFVSNHFDFDFNLILSTTKTNNCLFQHTGNGGHDGGDVTGEGGGGRHQKSSAGLRQGQDGEADERVSCHHRPLSFKLFVFHIAHL